MFDKLCGLQGVDVLDQLADGLQTLGLAEVNVALLLQVADQLDHVQGVDAQGVERGVVVDGLRVDVQVLFQDFLNGVDGSHDGGPFSNIATLVW